MKSFYRGTSLSQLLHNFEGDYLENNAPTKIASYDVTSSFKTAVHYADKHMEEGLVIVLEFRVPEKYIFQRDEVKDAYEAEKEGRILDKRGVETDFRTQRMNINFLRAIHEFKSSVDSIEEFKKKGHHIKLDNNPKKKVKKYLKERS